MMQSGTTNSGFVKVLRLGHPCVIVSQFCEGVCQALDVACAIIEEVESHGGRREKWIRVRVTGRRQNEPKFTDQASSICCLRAFWKGI
jgi:hypothetical protein